MSIYAEYTGGSIHKLDKDCTCQSHDGPHWLHMDEVARQMNSEIAEQSRNTSDGLTARLLFDRFCEEEMVRLERKKREMEHLGITRIIDEAKERRP